MLLENQNESLSWGSSDQEKGEVFTRPEVVTFMLITSGISLSILDSDTKILEPSCGQGEFIVAIAKILRTKIKETNCSPSFEQIQELVKAYDISSNSIDIAKLSTKEVLLDVFTSDETDKIVNSWFVNRDLLLTEFSYSFSHIIGNPPYVRIENIPTNLLNIYRSTFSTMKGRADLYIAFYEKCLSLLRKNGTLSFICTDRWTKNEYGSALRKYIANNFQLDLFVDLYGQNAFQSNVLTYPAITQISKRKQNTTNIIHNPKINDSLAKSVCDSLTDSSYKFEGQICRNDIINDSAPWLLGSADELEMIAYLEHNFPNIEDTGCMVYIGAATGNNNVYIIDSSINIEPSRKLPLVTAKDIRKGELTDTGKYIINTYDSEGVIQLNNYPLLESYLVENAEALKNRHIAKKSPHQWFKTIDKIHPKRAKAEKLLIPDIKSELTAIYDKGGYHPNNSIYYICSKKWNIRALQGVLLSGIGQLFVQAYSTKVSGGNLRFQAQHLRRIRLPFWEDVPHDLRDRLEASGINNDTIKAKELVVQLYKLNEKQQQILGC